ncbi:amino acid adenylation domain-containing protein [Streptomyces flaveolus]|uniref:non-ribosomal peptide synthetase n=1 Tax=Streptomyces flaveolus TaxID=67297 RepID=UPI0034262AB2
MSGALSSVPASDRRAPTPRRATATQRSIWFNERIDDCGAAHHVPFAVRLDGPLDVGALEEALHRVVRRHPALTSVVEDRTGTPHLVPGRAVPDVRLRPVASGERETAEERAFVQAPFDLARGPLLRARLTAQGQGRHRLLVVVHHIVFDGRSMEVFVDDLAAYYNEAVDGADAGLPALTAPDTAGPEEERIQAALPAARRYWERQPLDSGDTVLPWLDRSVRGTRQGTALHVRVPGDERDRWAAAAAGLGVTFFELLVASVHALLFRYGNATPGIALDVSTRGPGQDDIGAYVNEPPFFSRPRPFQTFGEFAAEIRSALRELYQVRDVPLGRAGVPVEAGVALADFSLSYRRAGRPPRFSGVRAAVDWSLSNGTSRNSIRIELVDGPDGLSVLVLYPSRSWQAEGPRTLTSDLLALVAHAAAAPGTLLADLPLTVGGGAARDAERDAPAPEGTVVDLVREQAARAPGAVAVISGERTLTYAGLDAAAGRLAARLRSRGVGPGSLVAVRVARSERLVVALLAVLRAGAAYIPLDPGYPAARLDLVRDDASAVCELLDEDVTFDALTDDGPAGHQADGDGGDPAPARCEPPALADAAYVIYTSGSTGVPKGVHVEHRALAHLVRSMAELLTAGPDHRWLALTSVSFDIAHLEILLPLATGGTVVMAEDGLRDGAGAAALIARHGVTHVQATPTGWSLMLDGGFHAPGVTALTGGEALSPALAERLLPAVGRLLNVYGPTETTIWSSCEEITDAGRRITIGRPLPGERLYVLDGRLRPAPAGVPGDLYIGGAGLARGYLRRPGLSAQRFVPDPSGPPGGRMYRTGDLARQRPDGRVEFLGRDDDQVKVRGHRIELGEIEARLLKVPGVAEAAAAVRGEKIVGYVTGSPDEGTARRALAAALPAYMVPDAIVVLDALPTTPNGKLDRRALPAPAEPLRSGPDAGTLDAVRGIWRETLGVPTLGDDESLFDLGGHSITMTRIATRIWDDLGVDVPLHAFFAGPTVRGIAAVVADLREGE